MFNDLSWFYKLMNYSIDCPEVLSLISLNVPKFSLGSTYTSHVPIIKRSYCLFALLNRIFSLGNKLENFDFFFYTSHELKNCLKIYYNLIH